MRKEISGPGKMQLMSIRWRLPLSYAAVALVAAACLGAVLFAVVREDYAWQEREYLESSALSFSELLMYMPLFETDKGDLQEEVQLLSFLSETRIQVLNVDGNVLADSGPEHDDYFLAPSLVYGEGEIAGGFGLVYGETVWDSIEFLPATSVFIPEGGIAYTTGRMEVTPFPTYNYDITLSEPGEAPIIIRGLPLGDFIPEETSSSEAQRPVFRALHTPFGVTLNASPVETQERRRSNQRVQVDVYDLNGDLSGYVVLSEGPAYGSEVIDNMARGFVLAGGVAVALAAVVGWLMSRRISEPVLALTSTTEHMAAGDFSVRSTIKREDEFGSLSTSFNTMAAHIENTVVALKRFVADAAHELHTPLTAIRTYLELGQETHSPDTYQSALVQIIRLQELADDLLVLSQVEAGTDRVSSKPWNICALMYEMSEIHASQAEQAGVDYTLDVPEQPIVISGIREHISRVLDNLLDNAIKFTPSGGDIHVGLKRAEQWVEITVSDTGIGIPEEDLPVLFERFQRGKNTSKYPGSGLGLAIVKAIVEAQGGTVSALSSSDGTTMSVRLPITE